MTTYFENTPVSVSVNIDYPNKRVYATLLHSNPALTNLELAKFKFSAVNELGVPICPISSFSKVTDYNGAFTALASPKLGLDLAGRGAAENDENRLYCSEILHPFFNNVTQFSVDAIHPKKDNAFRTTDPVIVRDGSCVFYGKITSTTDNTVYISGYTSSTHDPYSEALGTNFKGDLLYITSGPGSGDYLSIIEDGTQGVTEHNYFKVDGDPSSYVNQTMKIMQKTKVASWSGYTDDFNTVASLYVTDTLNHNLGAIEVETVTVVENLAGNNQDSVCKTIYTDINWDSDTNSAISNALGCSVVDCPDTNFNEYNVSPAAGDTLNFRPSNNHLNRVGLATIYRVEKLPSKWRMWVYPQIQPSNLLGYTDALVIPHSRFEVQNYPQFGENCLGIVNKTDGASTDLVKKVAAVHHFTSPTAELDFSANDYESIYGTVAETSHFHVGPIKLSGGKIIDNKDINFQLALYEGDPTKTNPVKVWNGDSTRNPNAAQHYNGDHYRLGVYVGTYEKVFLSAETMYLRATVSYGGAYLSQMFTIPVQPSP